ncbi:MAG: phosphotransferase family protein [Sulfurovum sp.]|nr:phosphotransferase family protein [Sulfurovum sp.]
MKKDLSECPPFGEVQLHKLPIQGYSNTNYFFIYHGRYYLFREFGLKDRDRDIEFHIQNLACRAGIAPRPYCLNKTFMITEYIREEHRKKLGVEDIARLAKTLGKLHRLPVSDIPSSVDLRQLIKIKTPEVKEAFETIEAYPKENVLCHNDLNPLNLLWSTEKIILIDWEFAGVNDRYFDLASVCVEFRFEEEAEKQFLLEYFKGNDYSLEKLYAYKVLYRVLCEAWFETHIQ